MNLRDALLCEGKLRIDSWYSNKTLEAPRESRGVTVQITTETFPCGGADVVAAFGKFDVTGVAPMDVFNAIADTASEAEWDHLVGKVTPLGDFYDQQARGFAISYSSPPFAPREVFMWQVVDVDDPSYLWIVRSSNGNSLLHEKKSRATGQVAAQQCLAAYKLQQTATGTHVTFTTCTNSHAWILPSNVVFNLVWGKTVDGMVAIRKHATSLAKERGTSLPSVVLPKFMLETRPFSSDPIEGQAVPPFASCYAPGSRLAYSEAAEAYYDKTLPFWQQPVAKLTMLALETPTWLLWALPAGMFAIGLSIYGIATHTAAMDGSGASKTSHCSCFPRRSTSTSDFESDSERQED